jgi:hypothetical protein
MCLPFTSEQNSSSLIISCSALYLLGFMDSVQALINGFIEVGLSDNLLRN